MYRASDYRDDIRAAEMSVSRVRRGVQAEEVLDLFALLDRLAEGYEDLRGSGADLRAELTRVETVHNNLIEKKGLAVRALAERGGVEALRAQIDPPAGRWWWTLDRLVIEERATRIRRLLWFVAGGTVLLAVLVVLYMAFLRPDEATRLRYQYTMDAEFRVEEGDYLAALENYQRAREIAPDDAEVSLMVGVMYEALERSEDAAAQYEQAAKLYETRAAFLATRSLKYAFIGWYDKGEADAQEATELDDQHPMGYYALGNAYEMQGRGVEAIRAFQVCADLARDQEQDQLYVIATMRLATLLEAPLQGGNTVEATPTSRE